MPRGFAARIGDPVAHPAPPVLTGGPGSLDVIIGGQSGISDHLTIGRGARLLVQSGYIGNVPAGATMFGYPARPHREFLRAQAALYRLSRIVDELEALVKPASHSPDH